MISVDPPGGMVTGPVRVCITADPPASRLFLTVLDMDTSEFVLPVRDTPAPSPCVLKLLPPVPALKSEQNDNGEPGDIPQPVRRLRLSVAATTENLEFVTPAEEFDFLVFSPDAAPFDRHRDDHAYHLDELGSMENRDPQPRTASIEDVHGWLRRSSQQQPPQLANTAESKRALPSPPGVRSLSGVDALSAPSHFVRRSAPAAPRLTPLDSGAQLGLDRRASSHPMSGEYRASSSTPGRSTPLRTPPPPSDLGASPQQVRLHGGEDSYDAGSGPTTLLHWLESRFIDVTVDESRGTSAVRYLETTDTSPSSPFSSSRRRRQGSPSGKYGHPARGDDDGNRAQQQHDSDSPEGRGAKQNNRGGPKVGFAVSAPFRLHSTAVRKFEPAESSDDRVSSIAFSLGNAFLNPTSSSVSFQDVAFRASRETTVVASLELVLQFDEELLDDNNYAEVWADPFRIDLTASCNAIFDSGRERVHVAPGSEFLVTLHRAAAKTRTANPDNPWSLVDLTIAVTVPGVNRGAPVYVTHVGRVRAGCNLTAQLVIRVPLAHHHGAGNSNVGSSSPASAAPVLLRHLRVT